MRKRDGPRIAASDQGPRQGGTKRPASLPQRKTPRNTTQGHPSTSHHQTRRRREQSWRGFSVRLYLRPGTEAHALYAFLKLMARRHGLEVADVTELDAE
jgi:hypothetical protein